MNTHMTRVAAGAGMFLGVLLVGTVNPALAQSTINVNAKHAWSENCGWLNFRDAGTPSGAQGVRITPTLLSGLVWGENIGYINLGSGTPSGGAQYSNANGTDFGVNRDPSTGELSGFAWGQNVGWINFGGGALAVPANPARVDQAAKRLRGYAWGENIGWINLDAAVFVGTCPADFNLNGQVTVQDIFDFLAAWFAASQTADVNGSGTVSVQDVFDYLALWFVGC